MNPLYDRAGAATKRPTNSVTDCLSVGSEADRSDAERAALASLEEDDVRNLSPNRIAGIPDIVKVIMRRVKLRGSILSRVSECCKKSRQTA